jgi:septal ring factor EnvC (AmiA/AmiB activator)
MNTDLLSKEVSELSATAITVKSDVDLQEASEWLAKFRKKRKEIEEQFEVPIKGLKAEVKQLQEQRDKLTAPLSTAEGKLSNEILTYRQKQQAAAAEAQRKLNAQHERKVEKAIEKGKDISEIAPPVQVATPAKSIQTDAGGVTARKVKKFKIADESLVPDQYWMLDEAKIGKAVRAGIEVPGVHVWEEETLSVR